MPSRRARPPAAAPLLRVAVPGRLHRASLRALLAYGACQGEDDVVDGLLSAMRAEAEALARAFEGCRETLYLANLFAGFQRRLACVQELRAREINGRVRLGGGR